MCYLLFRSTLYLFEISLEGRGKLTASRAKSWNFTENDDASNAGCCWWILGIATVAIAWRLGAPDIKHEVR